MLTGVAVVNEAPKWNMEIISATVPAIGETVTVATVAEMEDIHENSEVSNVAEMEDFQEYNPSSRLSSASRGTSRKTFTMVSNYI